jgi:hypothetical protein
VDSEKSLRNWLGEWISSHTLWELTSHLVRTVGAAWLGSYAWARLTHAALDTAVNVFLLVLGILGVAWGIGLLPVQKNKASAAEIRDSLKFKYNALILAWTQLDNLYQNSSKDDHAPKTLPDPMGSKQIGDLDFRYRIGVLQGKTYALLDDLGRAGIDIGYAKADIRSIPELLCVLERSKL